MKCLILLFLFSTSSCAIGYKKLTTEKLERKEKRGKSELILFNELPPLVSDTLTKEYEKYYQENKGQKNMVYSMSYFITFDSTITGDHIKYQDFYSEKFRLPFGYFFRFGKKKFFIPYAERGIGNTFIYFDGHLYFYGKYFGEPKEPIYKTDHPDRFKVDYENRAFWKIKL